MVLSGKSQIVSILPAAVRLVIWFTYKRTNVVALMWLVAAAEAEFKYENLTRAIISSC